MLYYSLSHYIHITMIIYQKSHCVNIRYKHQKSVLSQHWYWGNWYKYLIVSISPSPSWKKYTFLLMHVCVYSKKVFNLSHHVLNNLCSGFKAQLFPIFLPLLLLRNCVVYPLRATVVSVIHWILVAAGGIYQPLSTVQPFQPASSCSKDLFTNLEATSALMWLQLFLNNCNR